MKKLLFLMFYLTVIFSVKAQNVNDFCMPELQSNNEAISHIGQKIIVYEPNFKDEKYKDFEKFISIGCKANVEYIIKNIRVGKKIVVDLISNDDCSDYGPIPRRVVISKNKENSSKELSSCNLFFLVNKFNKEKNNFIGKEYCNVNGEKVAIVEDISIVSRTNESPIFLYTLKSIFTNTKCLCQPHEAEIFTKKIGTTLTHPNVKYAYKILGLRNLSEDFSSKYRYIYRLNYDYKNITTGIIKNCSTESINSIFEEDLRREYRAFLNSVDKPSYPEIRYGKIISISCKDNVSKYNFKDNVIDIDIFADNTGFHFILHNISGSSIKIIWNEAAFVNFDGTTEKVMHKGIKYSERNENQLPTTIINNAKWEDSVTPNNLVYFSKLTNTWENKDMFPNNSGGTQGQLKLMIPIQIKNIINEYVFTFNVDYVFVNPERLKDISNP